MLQRQRNTNAAQRLCYNYPGFGKILRVKKENLKFFLHDFDIFLNSQINDKEVTQTGMMFTK